VICDLSFDDLKLPGFKTNDKSPMTNSIAPWILSCGSIHAGTVEPFRVSPPEAVAYHFESDPSDSNVQFRRLVKNDKTRAIMYMKPAGELLAQFGIIWLAPDTLTPISSQLSSLKMKYAILDGRDYASEPAITVAADDQAVYLGFYQEGIIVFHKDGGSKLLTEETGLASNQIRSLDVLDGKLYALIGKSGSGIMQIDPKTGISTLLFSNKSKGMTNELEGKYISAMAADPQRHALWILCMDENAIASLYCYYPQEQKWERMYNSLNIQLKTMLSGADKMRKLNDYLVIDGHFSPVMLGTKTETAERIFGCDPPFIPAPNIVPNPTPKWSSCHTGKSYGPMQLVQINQDIVGMSRMELAYFHEGERDPEFIELSLLEGNSQRITFRDILLTEKGLLLLTDDVLYLIPKIAEQKPGKMLSEKIQPQNR
jgi:hypothetical protein